jgi:hypothetical protein
MAIAGFRGIARAQNKVDISSVILATAGTVGFFIALGIPFFQRWKAQKSCYAVTSRRALVFERTPIGAPKLTVYNPGDLTGMRRRDWWFFQDAGDLIFRTKVVITLSSTSGGYGPGRHGRGYGPGRGGIDARRSVTHYGFLSVRRPREIEIIIRESLIDPLIDKQNA